MPRLLEKLAARTRRNLAGTSMLPRTHGTFRAKHSCQCYCRWQRECLHMMSHMMITHMQGNEPCLLSPDHENWD